MFATKSLLLGAVLLSGADAIRAVCPSKPSTPENPEHVLHSPAPDPASPGEDVCVRMQYYRFCPETGTTILSDLSPKVCRSYVQNGFDWEAPEFQSPDWKICKDMYGDGQAPAGQSRADWMDSCAESYYGPKVVSGFMIHRVNDADTLKCLVVSVSNPEDGTGHWKNPAASFANETCLNEPSFSADGSCPSEPPAPLYPTDEDPEWAVNGPAPVDADAEVCVRLQYYRVCRDTGKLLLGPLGPTQCRDIANGANDYHIPVFKHPKIFNPSVESGLAHAADGVARKVTAVGVAYATHEVDGFILYRLPSRADDTDTNCVVAAGADPEDAKWNNAGKNWGEKQCIPIPEHIDPEPIAPMDANETVVDPAEPAPGNMTDIPGEEAIANQEALDAINNMTFDPYKEGNYTYADWLRDLELHRLEMANLTARTDIITTGPGHENATYTEHVDKSTYMKKGPQTCTPMDHLPVTTGLTATDSMRACTNDADCGGITYVANTQTTVYCDLDSVKTWSKGSASCDSTQACGFSRKFRKSNEDEKWTSYCSHVHCISVHWKKENGGLCESGTAPGQIGYINAKNRLDHDCVTQVRHSSSEEYGSKHVCKYEMHESGKCGCECYDEGEGFDIFDALDEDGDAASNVMTSQLTNIAHRAYKRAHQTFGFKERICDGGKKPTNAGKACTYTCSNPNPDCSNTVPVNRCECPAELPLWDELTHQCVVDLTQCEINKTPAPTVAPSAAPTSAPTAPTAAPTAAPTDHACDVHDNALCHYGNGGICVKNATDWSCDCDTGYTCQAGCGWENRHTPHVCMAA